MTSDLLDGLTTAGLSAELRSGSVGASEVTELYLRRIAEVDSELGAYITTCPEEALAAARVADGCSPAARRRRRLHGVPFAVKDQLLTRGLRTTAGSRILSDLVPDEDATAVARVRAAGGILLGKTNMTQFAAGMDDRYPYAEPRNPWDLRRTPGVSSGGSAIAVAASLASFALGEDTSGSLRSPASYCGIVGFRPSWGHVSRHGLLRFCWSMDTVGPMARTVDDAQLVLSVISGPDQLDMQTVPLAYEDREPGTVKGMRAALIEEWMDPDEVDEEVLQGVLGAVDELAKLGVSVARISWPHARYVAAVTTAISESDGAFVHRKWLRTRADEYGPNTRRRLLAASLLPSQALQKVTRLRAALGRSWLALFERFDVLLGPTTHTPAEPIAYLDGAARALVEARIRVRNPRFPAALAGTPALSVPCGFTAAGLPYGLQINGPPSSDEAVLALGIAYQEATDWHLRRPPRPGASASPSADRNLDSTGSRSYH